LSGIRDVFSQTVNRSFTRGFACGLRSKLCCQSQI
jgi:hypothetical protein